MPTRRALAPRRRVAARLLRAAAVLWLTMATSGCCLILDAIFDRDDDGLCSERHNPRSSKWNGQWDWWREQKRRRDCR